ncbi:MAG TPA: outer membrane protein assembly factor BamD [Nitrospira sp.]
MSIQPTSSRSVQRCTSVTLATLTTLLCLMAACSSNPKKSDTTAKKALSGTDESIFFGDEIEKNYDPNVIMKRGEAFFEKEEYAEAIIEYKHFLDLHRNHTLAPYAAFRIGESEMKRAKGISHDPEPIKKAIESFEKLRKEFPGNRYDIQAAGKIQECHDLLAQTHLFVGQFYYRRGSYLAAAHRFEQILKLYPDKSVAPDALYFLAMSYHDLGADDWASEKLSLMAARYPDSTRSKDAEQLLAKIGGSQPAALIASTPEPASLSNGSGSPASQNQTNVENGTASAPSAGTIHIPSANAFRQGFVSCRLGAWC